MPLNNRRVKPGSTTGTVLTDRNEVLVPPEDWAFLPAGDGPLTRSVKQRCCTWQVQIQKGRRTISKGIWAKELHIQAAREELESKRSTPEYARQRATSLRRRKRQHEEYVREFHRATLSFLAFHPVHSDKAELLAGAVTELATPVGSGTVARTERIPLEERVKAAVIAWLRHQTTGYDHMHIARIRGKRREVRRMLAQQSLQLLTTYRSVAEISPECPLKLALAGLEASSSGQLKLQEE